MSRPSIFQRYTDNLIALATVVATPAPMATYDEAVLLQHRVSARVRWDLSSPNSVQLVFTGPSQRVDLLVLPVHNVTDGTITLTSGTGMNESITFAAMRPSGMSPTLVADLAVLEPDVTKRTSTTFTLTISGNSAAIILGGFVGLYGPMRTFIDRDFQWNLTRTTTGFHTEHENDYGTDLVSSHDTQGNSYVLTTLATEADRSEIDDWLDANFVSGYPVFVWIDPDGRNIPLVCRVVGSPEFVDLIDGAIQISITVKELAKGEPVA